MSNPEGAPQEPYGLDRYHPLLQDAVDRIEAGTLKNPLAAVAIAAGVGFLLSKIRADRAARRLGLVPVIAGAAAGLFAKR
jgi:hypothetical protein